MARDSKTLERRNKDILAAIQREQKRNPKWQYIYIIEEVARQFYLKPSTIVRIISTGQ